ncbi:pyridoxal-phosphate dependent enzyme, partial [Deltaproteobacteria bacterium PRO3]|nr:pyridoxal-phosphate dependent enzyme [Deltaproteobacteria bacterium PRO3]
MELLSAASSSRLDAAARAEIQSLQHETDPALAAEAWLAFAGRQEQAGRIETAAEIYANAVGAVPPLTGDKRERPLQRSAQARLDAILGGGPFGARFEFLARNFAAQAADPAMLAGMGAAATVSSLVRLGALSRLVAAPTANLLMRGAGARWLAAGAAFAPEVGAFWGASRLANAALGREQAWDARSVSREFASLGLGLGLLKLGGWASRGLFDRVHGIDPMGGAAGLPALTRWSRPLAEQAGLFAGIGLAHSLETRLGLRPAGSAGSFWSDSLATLLQFHVGGRLSRELLGPRHAAWMQGLALRTRGLEAPRTAGGGGSLEGMDGGLGIFFQAATPEGLRLPVPRPEVGPRISNVAMMSHLEGDTRNLVPSGSGGARRWESNGSAEQQRRLIVRVGVERRIEAGDPEYFTPERLGMLPSRLRRGFFTRSEHARIQHAIRRYLNERGLQTFPLDHPLVQERIAQLWRNPRAGAAFSERLEGTLREIERAKESLASMSFADGTRFEPSRFRRSEGLSQELGTEFFFLNDAARPTGSFKERGALVEVHRVAQAGALHVVTASHGNHGLAVALAAQKLGLRST